MSIPIPLTTEVREWMQPFAATLSAGNVADIWARHEAHCRSDAEWPYYKSVRPPFVLDFGHGQIFTAYFFIREQDKACCSALILIPNPGGNVLIRIGNAACFVLSDGNPVPTALAVFANPATNSAQAMVIPPDRPSSFAIGNLEVCEDAVFEMLKQGDPASLDAQQLHALLHSLKIPHSCAPAALHAFAHAGR